VKILILTLACIIFINASTNAQYKINKTKYDFRTFKHHPGDPYDPTVAGIASFLFPGVGQMVSGEAVRGAVFLGGYAGFLALLIIGSTTGDIDKAIPRVAIGFSGIVVLDVISVIDAVHVAKVNNLAFRDRKKISQFQISPYIGSFVAEKIPVGLSLRVRF
jgi:hypothetical protein